MPVGGCAQGAPPLDRARRACAASCGPEAIRRSSHDRGAVELRPSQGPRAPARKTGNGRPETGPFPEPKPSVSKHRSAPLRCRGRRGEGGAGRPGVEDAAARRGEFPSTGTFRSGGEGQKGRGGFCIRKPDPAPKPSVSGAAPRGVTFRELAPSSAPTPFRRTARRPHSSTQKHRAAPVMRGKRGQASRTGAGVWNQQLSEQVLVPQTRSTPQTYTHILVQLAPLTEQVPPQGIPLWSPGVSQEPATMSGLHIQTFGHSGAAAPNAKEPFCPQSVAGGGVAIKTS